MAVGQIQKISNAEISFEFPSKKVKGTIEGFESTSKIDFDDITKSSFKGSVEAKTLDTNNFLRNLSLRSGKYFDVNDYPKITFESTSIVEDANEYVVSGMLTLKGQAKLTVIRFKKDGNQLIGSTQIYSSDFGIKIKKEREDNLVKVNFIFEVE